LVLGLSKGQTADEGFASPTPKAVVITGLDPAIHGVT
jgi:hypothetical protein